MWHFNPVQRLSDRAAFAAHTRGGWRAVHRDDVGLLVVGAPATFAAWDTPAGLSPHGLPVLEPDSPLPRCRLTVLDGTPVFVA